MLITPEGLVALTGPPNSWKTSVKNRLKDLGQTTLHEVPAELIAEGIHPLDDWEWFDKKRWERQLRNETALARYPAERGPAFLDRTLLEMVAYNRATGRRIPSYINEVLWPRYRLFFMLPAQPWKEDGLRYEAKGDLVKAREFQEYILPFLWEAYLEYGGKGYDVPNMAVNDQAEFILDVCRHEQHLLAA